MSTLRSPEPDDRVEDRLPSPRAVQRTGSGVVTIDTARLVRIAVRAAVVGPLLVVLFLVFLFGASNLEQARSQHQLLQAFATEMPTGTLDALDAAVAPGAAVALLEIPALHLQQVVVEGTSPSELKSGPGHLPSSPLPGEFGDAVLVGRHLAYGASFRELANLKAEDPIVITTGQGIFRYTVTSIENVPATQGYYQPSLDSRLTLISGASTWGSSRVVVTSTLEGDPLGVATRPAVSLDDASLGVGVDAAAYPLTLLWGSLLVFAAIAARRMYAYWASLAAYLITAPVLMLLLWLTFENLTRLLPGTL